MTTTNTSSTPFERTTPRMIFHRIGLSVIVCCLLLASPLSVCHAFSTSSAPTTTHAPRDSITQASSTRRNTFAHRPLSIQQSSPSLVSSATHYSTSCLHAASNNYDDDEIGDWNLRLKCCFPYLLPLLDGNHFGCFLFQRIPLLGQIDDLLLGGTAEFLSNTGLGLLVFVAFTLGTRFQFDMDRNLRFNAQQAALIDIVLVLPEIVSESVDPGDVPQRLAEPCANFVYYALVAAVGYSVSRILIQNQKPSGIPYLSDYAETMVGPL